jgi:hypothetical protein
VSFCLKFKCWVNVINLRYVAPSRRTITRGIDEKTKRMEEALKKEIREDIQDTKTVSVTTDGGPSHDVNKTKKKTVTISRIDSKWNMKTDTLALVVAEGSQTGEVIRSVVKNSLDKFGHESDWQVNITPVGFTS